MFNHLPGLLNSLFHTLNSVNPFYPQPAQAPTSPPKPPAPQHQTDYVAPGTGLGSPSFFKNGGYFGTPGRPVPMPQLDLPDYTATSPHVQWTTPWMVDQPKPPATPYFSKPVYMIQPAIPNNNPPRYQA